MNEPTTITVTFEVPEGYNEKHILTAFKHNVLDKQPYSWHVNEVYTPPKS